MHKKHSSLTEDARWQVTWTLRCHAHGQAVLASLLRDGFEVFQPCSYDIIPDRPTEKLLGLIYPN